MPDQTARRRTRRSTATNQRHFSEWVWVTLFLVILAGLIGWQNGLNHLELAFYDQVLATEARPASADIVLIGIDDASVAKYGAWPFPDQVQDQFFQAINADDVRGLAMVSPLAGPNNGHGEGDAEQNLPGLISANGHIALSSGPFLSLADRGTTSTPPNLLAAAAAVGADIQISDDDGLVRRAPLSSDVRGKPNSAPHLVTALLDAAKIRVDLPGRRAADVDGGPTGVGDHWVLIPYSGGPNHYPFLSYADVVAGKIAPAALAGKLVLVGRVQNQAVMRRVPNGASEIFGSALMTPIEVDANLLAGVLEGRLITPVLPLTNALGCVAPVLLAMILLYLRVRRALLVTLGIAALTVLAAVLLVPLGQAWFAPGGAIISLGLALPIWRWRQLEADAHRADHVLERLEAAPDHYAESTLLAPEAGLSRIEQRMQALSRTVYRVSELRFFIDHLVEALPQSVLVTNADGHIVAANRQARNYFASLGNTRLEGAQLPYLLGLMTLEGSAEGRSWWDIMDLSVAAPQARARDVRNRDLLVRATAWQGVNGEIGGWFATIEDVSAVRTLERRRNDALQFMGETVISTHRSIIEALDALAYDENHPNSVLETARQTIIASSSNALSMTEKFIELSNAESRDYVFAVSDVSDAIELAVDGAYSQADARGIRLVVRKPARPAFADIDMLMLSRSLSILIGNGLRFSESGQQVEIAIEEQGGEAVFTIVDYGRGIAPLQQARMMRSLQPIHSASATTRAAGFGLGLSFVRIVTEKHHGRIEFNSNPGQGSTFRLILPAVKNETSEGLTEPATL
jgi:CHASE2 domain-containing sensor protein/signal transduction histidine kinase